MNIEQVVREVTVRGSAPGMDGVARAYDQVSVSGDRAAVTFERNSKASETVDRALEKLRIRYIDGYREQQKFTEAQETYRRAVEQGRLTQQQAAAELANVQANLQGVTAAQNEMTNAANDNARGMSRSGLEIASTANHLKTAAVAAYAFSPAFRSLANPVIATGLRGIASAASLLGPAVATGIGALVAGFAPIAATILRVAGPILLVMNLVKALVAIFEIGGRKVEEFSAIAQRAGQAGVSTDFLQQQEKAAEALDLKLGDVIKRFKEISAEKLGGSDFQQRLKELTKAGNFEGNAGVAAYKQAVTVEEKYRAAAQIISIAIEKGERLAGLDLAAKFLPPEMLERLRANGELLRELQAAADAVKPADIISQEQIAYADDLKRRMEEARKVVDGFFAPQFVEAGLRMQGVWVAIVEKAAEWVKALYDVVEIFQDIGRRLATLGNAPFWTKLNKYLESKGLMSSPESMGLIEISDPAAKQEQADRAFANAKSRIAAQLRDQANRQRAMQEVSDTSSRVRGDSSRDVKKEQEEVNDAVDRAINTLRRHAAQQEADAKAIGLGAGALERFRAESALAAAIAANDGEITAKQAKEYTELAVRAEKAAVALAKAQVNSQIEFDRKALLLSDDDVRIAQQLRSIYGNDIPAALASSEAAAMRMNKAVKDGLEGLRDVGKSVFSAFVTGKNVMDALVGSLDRLASKLADSAFDNLISGVLSANPIQAGIGAVQAGASALISAFTGDQKKKQQAAADRAEYQKQLGQIDAYIAKANGQSNSLTDAIASARAEMDGFVAAAAKVKDWAKVAQLQDAYVKNVIKITEDEQQRAIQAIRDRASAYDDRVFAAGNDNTSLEGQLAAAEREFAKQRAAEVKAGGEAINNLIAAQEAEKANIIKRVADEAKAYVEGVAKNIRDYLTGLALGNKSILSPAEQLAAAQRAYDQQLAATQSTDEAKRREALGSITQTFDALLDAASKFYAGGQGYVDIYNRGNADLSSLAGGAPSVAPFIAAPAAGTFSGVANSNTPAASAAAVDLGPLGSAINVQTQVIADGQGNLAEAVESLSDEVAGMRRDLSLVLARVA